MPVDLAIDEPSGSRKYVLRGTRDVVTHGRVETDKLMLVRIGENHFVLFNSGDKYLLTSANIFVDND